jgi:4-amino-4-deoxy-L-arabinose transferase-like glycosyltransferase
MKKPLIFILALAFLIRLVYLFYPGEILWDSAVYVGMGKFLWSFGQSGFWEHIRPPLLPIVLGLFWKIGLNPFITGKILSILVGIAIVYLTFLVGRQYSDNVAIAAATFMAFSPILFYLSFQTYTELPSILFVLLAVYYIDRPFIAGLMAGLAFLTKFPAGIVILCIIAFYSLSQKWKPVLFSVLTFFLTVLPLLLFNSFAFSNPFLPFVDAQKVILQVVGCNVLNYQPWYSYVIWLIKESLLYFLLPLGIFISYRKKMWLPLIFFALPFLYLLPSHCRDYRYLAFALPFAALLVGFVLEKLKNKWLIVGVVLLFTLPSTLMYFNSVHVTSNQSALEYYNYDFPDGDVWTSNPLHTIYSDKSFNLLYYPVYSAGSARLFIDHLNNNSVAAVAVDNCAGGLICPPDDAECTTQTELLLQKLDEKYDSPSYTSQSGRCWYKVFTA